MKNRNRQAGVAVVLPLVLMLLLTGCSGINASKSVSPATFLMPGLLGMTGPWSPDAPATVLPPV